MAFGYFPKPARSLLAAFSVAVPLSITAEEIRISVSDLLADTLEAPLVSFEESFGGELRLEGIGTLPALDRLRADEIDMAVIAVPEGEEVPREEFSVYPLAYDVAVIAVNESNPMDEISVARLGGIFGSNEEFNFTSWGDLGLSGWGTRSIKPIAGMTDESIALELFKYSVLRSGTLRSSVAIVRDDEVENLLLSDAASIAVMTRPPKDRKLKTVMISGAGTGPAFGPTEDNVHYGDYPIRLAYYVAYHPRDDERLKPVLRTLLSDEVAEALRADNVYALPDTVRRKLAIDLDLKK